MTRRAQARLRLRLCPLNKSTVYLQPVAGTVWRSGLRIDVTVDATVTDPFGKALGAPRSAHFLPVETETPPAAADADESSYDRC